MNRAGLMTIGELSRRVGIPVKALRGYTDAGLVYSAGRSPAGYRLFDESALWCAAVISQLRSLGLTVAEIREIAEIYLGQPGEPIGPHIADRLRTARGRVDARISELRELRQRIDEALAGHRAELAGDAFRATDPRCHGVVDSAPRGRP
jgi:MerR family transcriptional regulator, copper efflux regulator